MSLSKGRRSSQQAFRLTLYKISAPEFERNKGKVKNKRAKNEKDSKGEKVSEPLYMSWRRKKKGGEWM